MNSADNDRTMFLAQGAARTPKVDVKIEVRTYMEVPIEGKRDEVKVYWPNLGKTKPQGDKLPVTMPKNWGIWSAGALGFGALDRLSKGSQWVNSRLSFTDDRMMLLQFKVKYMYSESGLGAPMNHRMSGVTYILVSESAPDLQMFARLPMHPDLALYQTREDPGYGRLRVFDGPGVPVTSLQVADDELPYGVFEEQDPWGQGVQAHDRAAGELPDGVEPLFLWEGIGTDSEVTFAETASGESRLVSIPKEKRKRRLRPGRSRRS